MSKGQDPALRLILIDDSVEEAETIVSGLRNAGIAVRPLRPGSVDELADMLASQPVDLLLASEPCKSLPMAEVQQHVAASGKDIPIIAIIEQIDSEIFISLMTSGVRAIALRHKPQQLLTALRTEWADLDARRNQRRLEAQVRETERRCDNLIESSREPIAYIHEGMHIRANSAYLEMFGFDSFEDIEGMSLLDLVAPEYVNDFKQLLRNISKGEPPPARYELKAHDLDGNPFPAVMEFALAQYEGESCQQLIFRRQESDPALAREVEELRQRDQATGLFNRPTFLLALENAVAETVQTGARHGLLLIEPDHYQRLLQEIGLDSADKMFASIAERLRQQFEGDIVAARFADTSFAVLLRNADYNATHALATRICNAFAKDVVAIGQRSAVVTVSIGGVQISEKIASVSQILAKANDGVQSVGLVGGNRAEIFDPTATDRAEAERIQAWVHRLRDGLEHRRFTLHFQPVINLHGDNSPVYDTLLRLEGGEGELISPANFMQIAEEHDMLEQIDRYVVDLAIELIAKRHQSGKPVTLLVKITHHSLQDGELAAYIGRQLEATGVPGKHLVLQMQESKVFTHLKPFKEFIAAVSQHGCQVGLEQFGGGIDSLQLLAHVQPQLLKIDRSFIEDLPKNQENQQKVRTIAERARELNIQTVAEFVQDAASMSILYSAGVDFVEGHFLAAAGPDMNYDFE